MCVYVHVCISVCRCVSMFLYAYVCEIYACIGIMCISESVCACVNGYVYECPYMSTLLCAPVSVYLFVSVSIHVWVYVHLYEGLSVISEMCTCVYFQSHRRQCGRL